MCPRRSLRFGSFVPTCSRCTTRNRAIATRSAQFLRHGRVGGKDRAETLDQWAEPGLEMPPIIDRLRGDGPAHLLGAWRQNCPLRFIKSQAALLERQPEIIEQLADFGFRTG